MCPLTHTHTHTERERERERERDRNTSSNSSSRRLPTHSQEIAAPIKHSPIHKQPQSVYISVSPSRMHTPVRCNQPREKVHNGGSTARNTHEYKASPRALSCCRHRTRLSQEHVSERASQRALRSATNNDMVVPRSRLKFGERAFSIAAPRAWNSIPAGLHATLNTATLKKNLKTFLFREAYSTF